MNLDFCKAQLEKTVQWLDELLQNQSTTGGSDHHEADERRIQPFRVVKQRKVELGYTSAQLRYEKSMVEARQLRAEAGELMAEIKERGQWVAR